MNLEDALSLLRSAVPAPAPGAAWVDFGAGTGLFTRALAALLGPEATVVAVDWDARALARLRSAAPAGCASIHTLVADMRAVDFPRSLPQPLGGALFANSLHYLPDPHAMLERVLGRLEPRGRVVLIEYDRTRANRWVPYPLPRPRLDALARSLGLAPPRVVATRPSAFGGELYCAVLHHPPIPSQHAEQ